VLFGPSVELSLQPKVVAAWFLHVRYRRVAPRIEGKCHEHQAGHEKAFGKVGLKKLKRDKSKRK
jgi:hypothetical protein